MNEGGGLDGSFEQKEKAKDREVAYMEGYFERENAFNHRIMYSSVQKFLVNPMWQV